MQAHKKNYMTAIVFYQNARPRKYRDIRKSTVEKFESFVKDKHSDLIPRHINYYESGDKEFIRQSRFV